MHIFSGRQQTVLSSVTSELKGASPAAFGSLGEEDQDYFTYIINQLKEKKSFCRNQLIKRMRYIRSGRVVRSVPRNT